MKLGIVGSEQAKFTNNTENNTRYAILKLIQKYNPTHIVSGACHLGGVDSYAAMQAKVMGIELIEFKPKDLNWSQGYQPRNLQIARESDHVVCLTVKELPPNYKGMRFNLCYHCNTRDHVKSGGCWTVKQAMKMGKTGEVIVIGHELPEITS